MGPMFFKLVVQDSHLEPALFRRVFKPQRVICRYQKTLSALPQLHARLTGLHKCSKLVLSPFSCNRYVDRLPWHPNRTLSLPYTCSLVAIHSSLSTHFTSIICTVM